MKRENLFKSKIVIKMHEQYNDLKKAGIKDIKL